VLKLSRHELDPLLIHFRVNEVKVLVNLRVILKS